MMYIFIVIIGRPPFYDVKSPITDPIFTKMGFGNTSGLKVNKFQNENMKSSHCSKYERKNLKNCV